MQLKKLLQGSAFALVAAACAIAVPSVVKAADGAFEDVSIASVSVDGTKGTMEIKAADSNTPKEILVGIGKIKKDVISVASWGSYEPDTNKKVTVDLSKLNNVKDNYIVITTPGKDSVSVVKVKPTEKTTKAKFNAKDGLLQAASGEKVSNSDLKDLTKETGAIYEFKTPYSGWQDLVTGTDTKTIANMSLYQEEGAKLVVRLKGSTDGTTALVQGTEVLTYGTELKVKVYDSKAKLPGKEAKVTVAAKAKGPKITADYVNGKVKFPKNTEYRLATTTYVQAAGTDGKYVAGPTAATEISKIADTDDEVKKTTVLNFDIEARTIANDKKAASKWSRLSVVKPAAIDTTTENKLLVAGEDIKHWESNSATSKKDGNGTVPTTVTADVTYTGKGVTAATLREDKSGGNILTIKYVAKKLPKDSKYTENAVEITNNGESAYEFIVGTKGATAAPTTGKVAKVAKGSKITLTGVSDLDTIWVRVAGDKKNTTWVGAFTKLGIVDYGYKVAAPKSET